ncbi:MAG: hypothetical protein ABJN36_13130 [Cyclobacteriaceae bacterium]
MSIVYRLTGLTNALTYVRGYHVSAIVSIVLKTDDLRKIIIYDDLQKNQTPDLGREKLTESS